MAEFEPPVTKPSPEEQLFARLKLQRVVFGAFAIVLVSLFALGLSAYRHMQGRKADAEEAAGNARQMQERACSEALDLERDLQLTRDELAEARRKLALAKCRLAIHEIHGGDTTRARLLLDQARELGAPPWWPLVDQLSRERAVRFQGSESPAAPIIAGAVNHDGTVVAAARSDSGSVIVEVYAAASGKLQLAYPRIEAEAGGPGRLLLSRDGSAWYLSLPGRALYGSGGAVLGIDGGPTVSWEPAPVSGIAGNDDLSVICEAHGSRGLVVRRRGEGGQWTSEAVTLDVQGPAVDVCLAGEKPVVATATGIYLVGVGGRTGLLYALDAPADRYALHPGVGVVYAALLRGRGLDVLAIKPGEDLHVAITHHEFPDEPIEGLHFLLDDTVVWTGRAGRLGVVGRPDADVWTLGEYPLSFVERHPAGLVFGNSRGELGLRTQPEFASTGRPLHLVPPDFSAKPAPGGFILASPGNERFVLHNGRVRALAHALNVELAKPGPAWVEDVLLMPDGSSSTESGELSGAFSDGSVLLLRDKKLKLVSPQGVAEFPLAGDRVPDEVVVAAEAQVAALRLGDNVYVADMVNDPLAVAGRRDVAPDLITLDAGALRLAIAYGPTVVVQDLRAKSELTVRTGASPRQIALLFGGSVLVTIESGELVFYEVEAGRELFRAGVEVTDIVASGDDSLNLVVGGCMQELKLGG
jgi:hypothetical protein